MRFWQTLGFGFFAGGRLRFEVVPFAPVDGGVGMDENPRSFAGKQYEERPFSWACFYKGENGAAGGSAWVLFCLWVGFLLVFLYSIVGSSSEILFAKTG